jgi:hypothetical protein
MKISVFWGVTVCSSVKTTDVSVKHIDSIFKVEEEAKQETSMKQNMLAACFILFFLLGLFFDPVDGGYMFLRNVDLLTPDCTASYPRRYNSSHTSL